MFNKLKNNKMTPFFSILTIIVILVFLPFIWLPEGYMINSEDQIFMNYEILFEKASYSWTNFSAFGSPATAANHSLIIPNAYFYKLLRNIGTPIDITQKLFIGINILLMLTAFWLFATLLTKKKHLILLAILAYFLNFYILVSLTYTAKTFQLILTPLIFFLTYRYLETRKIVYLTYHFIIFFVFQGFFTNLTQIIAFLPIYFFSGMFYCLKNKKHIFSIIKPLFLFFLITLPIYIYHGLVYYFSLYVNLDSIKNSTTFTAFFTNFYKMFQIRGIWWEDTLGPNGIPYNNWIFFLNNPLIILISFLFPITIFYILLIKNKVDKTGLFFLFLYLFYFALSTGISFFPLIYEWFYYNFPFFYIFREPWPKFTPGLIFTQSALILISLNKLYVKQKYYQLIYLTLLIAILIKGYPFFSPQFYTKWKKDLSKIPNYWLQYRYWSSTHRDDKILPIPFFKSRGEFYYDWNNNKIGKADSEMPFIFSSSNVFRYYDNSDLFSSIISSSLENKNFDFIKLGQTNYVLLQKDLKFLNPGTDYSWQETSILKYVEKKPITNFEGKLFIYKIKAIYHTPTIFIPNKIIFIKQSNYLTKADTLSNLEPNTSILPLYENRLKINNKLFFEQINQVKNKPLIEFSKINPTKYKLLAHHVKETFPLVLEESFNSEWKIYLINNKTKESLLIDESKHLIINGFLNAWILNPNELCNTNNYCKINKDKSLEMEFVIEYQPQKLFTIVSNLNLLIFYFSILYIIINQIIKLLKKNEEPNLENISL